MKFILSALTLLLSFFTFAQEGVTPLLHNPRLSQLNPQPKKTNFVKRNTPIILPLWEDFSYCDHQPYPTDNWWIDSSIYINNHFVNNQINKGVATFDVLDAYGRPYHSSSAWSSVYCDSLTSYYIDLSEYTAADSIYISFNYQCGGLGFMPKAADSLLIFFEDEINGWTRAGFVRLDTTTGWKYAAFVVKDGNYFYENFRFRIINKGTIGTSGSHWHIDNIYMNANRTYWDTTYMDMAFTQNPTPLLNDFTAMPFKHFATDRDGFAASEITAFTRLNANVGTVCTIGYMATNAQSGILYSSSMTELFQSPYTAQSVNFPKYGLEILSPDPNQYLEIEHKYYIASVPGDTTRDTDTIIQRQIFSNYFAYDDGTAEQAYYLNLAPLSAGKIAIEYATYVPDTLSGVAIQFARQVPSSEEKEFFIQIYRDIELGGSGGELIYEEQGFIPVFPEGVQQFHIYPLKELVPLPPGIFHVVIMMPASGVSDSLMIALDKNRSGANHRYFSVLDVWEPSLLEGALMVRPIMGGKLLSVDEHSMLTDNWYIYPNPSNEIIYLQHSGEKNFDELQYSIIDILGNIHLQGKYQERGIYIQSLPAGNYILYLQNHQGARIQLPFTKI